MCPRRRNAGCSLLTLFPALLRLVLPSFVLVCALLRPCPCPCPCCSQETLQAFLDLLSYRVQLADLFDLQNNSNLGAAAPPAAPSPHLSPANSASFAPGSFRHALSMGGGSAHLHTHSHSHSNDDLTSLASLSLTSAGPSYVFRGFVGYYGLHYISVFQDRTNAEDGQFLLFDDTTVRSLGGWEQVRTMLPYCGVCVCAGVCMWAAAPHTCVWLP